MTLSEEAWTLKLLWVPGSCMGTWQQGLLSSLLPYPRALWVSSICAGDFGS